MTTNMTRGTTSAYPVVALTAETWPAFEALAARHNGIFNGCYNATRSVYERLGFTYDRPKGLKNCVMVTTVASAPRR